MAMTSSEQLTTTGSGYYAPTNTSDTSHPPTRADHTISEYASAIFKLVAYPSIVGGTIGSATRFVARATPATSVLVAQLGAVAGLVFAVYQVSKSPDGSTRGKVKHCTVNLSKIAAHVLILAFIGFVIGFIVTKTPAPLLLTKCGAGLGFIAGVYNTFHHLVGKISSNPMSRALEQQAKTLVKKALDEELEHAVKKVLEADDGALIRTAMTDTGIQATP
ncbi:MAG: hypothetical protein OXF02_07995 [Simkaniaceae bacterium]|nr:hypothetical protein [Simkaniaceae bacterium]